MKEEEIPNHCYNCKLIRKLKNSRNVYAFLDKTYPISNVLNNIHEISPENLKCICCLYGNSLCRLYSVPRRMRLKNPFIPCLRILTYFPFIGKHIKKSID